MKVVTLTANPLLDKFVYIDKLVPGKSHRARSVTPLAGGKGINVSRQLSRLGVGNIATGFLGGATGEQIRNIAEKDGIACDFVSISATTREAFTMFDSNQEMTIVFEPPAAVTSAEVQSLYAKLEGLLGEGDWLVFSGSVPTRELDSLYADLITWSHERKVGTFLDTYGAALDLGLKAKPTFVKVNDEELGAFLHKELKDEKECILAVREIAAQYARHIVLTRGAESFFAASSGEVWHGIPPKVKAVNALGSGDSMAAGILYGLSRGESFESAVKWGSATGAANAARQSVSDVPLEEVELLLSDVALEKVGS